MPRVHGEEVSVGLGESQLPDHPLNLSRKPRELGERGHLVDKSAGSVSIGGGGGGGGDGDVAVLVSEGDDDNDDDGLEWK